MSDIDASWRDLVKGTNHNILVKLIQNNVEAFIEFCSQNNLTNANSAESNSYFRDGMSTQDLSKLKKLFTFKYLNFENNEINLLGFKNSYASHLGWETWNGKLGTNDFIVDSIVRFHEFFELSLNLINVRHVNSHLQTPRNDSGWALLVSGYVSRMIELDSAKDTTAEDISILKGSLLDLLREVIEIEDDERKLVFDSGEDDASEEMEKQLNLMEEFKINFFDTLKEDLLEQVKQIAKSSIKETIDEDKLEKIEVLEDLPDDLEYQLDPHGQDPSEFENSSDEEDFIEYLSNDAGEPKNTDEPTISNSLTAVQAKRELLIIRKRIKAKTKCKNWENVLQGDYINDIIANKISNVDEFQDWLNTLEGEHYNSYQEKMVLQLVQYKQQINRVLERISWN